MAKKNVNLDNMIKRKKELRSYYNDAGKLSSQNVKNLTKELGSSNKIALSNKEIEKSIRKINDEHEKTLKTQEQIKVEQAAQYEILKQQLGLTKEQMNIYVSIENFQNKIQDVNKKSLSVFKNMDSMDFSKIFKNPMAAMDAFSVGLVDKVLNTGKTGFLKLSQGMNLFKGGIKGVIPALGGMKGILMGLGGVLASTGILAGILAIQVAVAGVVKMFDVMMKFNFGGIATEFGAAFAQIKNIWKIFEINIMKTLEPIEPIFRELFGGLASFVVTAFSTITEIFGGFFEGFTKSFGDVEKSAGGFKDVFSSLIPILKTMGSTLQPIFSVIGKITGSLFQLLIPAFKLLGAVVPPLLKVIMFALDPIIWAIDKLVSGINVVTSWMGGGSGETDKIVSKEAESTNNTQNVFSSNNISRSVTFNNQVPNEKVGKKIVGMQTNQLMTAMDYGMQRG